MPRRLIDISCSLRAGISSDPPGLLPAITYHSHADTVGQVSAFFPGLEVSDLPDGEGWAIETIRCSTHNGTHLDAPYHFASTMDRGARALTIDEVPLEWCFSPGVKLDFRHLPDGHVVTAAELEAEFARIEHALQPLDIVLSNTSAGAKYGGDEYVASGCGMGREATLYLTSRGVRVTGTDAWSWDAPFIHTRRRWEATRDPSIIWEGHKAGREIGYCHIEKPSNLEALPANGFTTQRIGRRVPRVLSGQTTVAIAEASGGLIRISVNSTPSHAEARLRDQRRNPPERSLNVPP